MKVLMISGDPGVLDPKSSVAKRMEEYRQAFGELDILLCRGNIFNFIYGFFRGLKIIWHKKPDAITAQSPEHAVFAWIFSKIYRIPWQMQIHTDILNPYFAKQSLFNWIRVRLAKFLLPRANGIRVVSERIKKSLVNYKNLLSDRIAVLPVFVDIEKIKKTPVKIDLHKKYPDKFIILMASRITKEKNIEMAVDAIRRLPRIDEHLRGSARINQRESALLLIVGDGSEKKHLQDYAQSLKLGDSVVFEPAVDFETLVSYYKTVNLFLLTSFYEGWPLAPIEALASGLPVVMTDVVSGHETIKDGVNAAIVPIGDSRALALRISQLIESPEKLAQLKKGAENSFPNPLSKEKYLELHTKLLKDIAKPKVCYILPLYEEGTDTHFFYNYLLIKEVAKRQDIFVVVEKCPTSNVGQIKQNLRISNCYIQKFKFPPLRFLEMLFICLRLRLSGYKNFYVHYSYYGALAVWLTTWLSDNQVRIFYWNRGMPWLFNRSRFKEKLFKFVLRHTILVTGPESLAKEYVVRYGVKEYRVVSNWVDVERFSPSTNRLNENSLKSERLEGLSKAQVLQDLAWRDGASRAIRQQANMRVLAKLGAEAKPGSRIVLFVHHLSKRKGADLIPEIAKGFGDDTLFLVVGDGPELEYLKERASFKFGDASEPPERGLSARNLEHARSNIVLLGKVPNSEIPKLFHAADVFFMPSREEGSPRVILEAMASGVPFVASDVGGTRELVPRNLAQFLCKPEDVKCFRDKIKTLLSDKALYDKARAECLAHAKNFDISRGVKEFIDLFKNT